MASAAKGKSIYIGCNVNARYRRDLLVQKQMVHIYQQFFGSPVVDLTAR
jgi:hypothetical protein